MSRAPPAWPRPDGGGGASAPSSRSPSGPPSRVGARPQRARVRPPSSAPPWGRSTGHRRTAASQAARATAPEARGAARSVRCRCADASHPGPRARVRCSGRVTARSSAGQSSSPRRHPRWCDPALTARSPERAASRSDPGPTGASLPDPRRSDDQQPAPWPASATHGAPAYPLRDRTGIQAESFVRNPYHRRLRLKVFGPLGERDYLRQGHRKLGLGPIPLRCKLILSGSQLDHLFAKLLLDGRGGVSKVHRSPAHEGQKGHREAEAPVQASCLAWLRTRDHRNVSSSEHSASPGGWRWRHPVEIREAYGYRTFDAPGLSFRLTRWLYALCWTGTDRPSVLFDRATVWLMAGKVLLPGATTLERLVARVRARASERLWQRLSMNVTPAQRERLEALLVVPEIGRRQSPLDRLRNGPVLTSGKELARTVRRLGEVQDLARDLPWTDRVPRSRVLALARFATASKAQAIMRLPDQRRVATLLAFVRTLEASAQDDVLDLFDVVVTRIFADAKKREEEARLRSLRDLDAAALVLRGVGAPVLPLLKQVRAAALARATPSPETAGANSTPALAFTQADLIAAIGAVSPSEIAALATPVPEAIE